MANPVPVDPVSTCQPPPSSIESSISNPMPSVAVHDAWGLVSMVVTSNPAGQLYAKSVRLAVPTRAAAMAGDASGEAMLAIGS